MPTSNERKALWFLAAVAISGTGVRLWRAKATPVSPAHAQALAHQIERVDSARSTARARKTSSRPAARTTPRPRESEAQGTGSPGLVDLDRATSDEMEALPGIGPSIARRIVANRDSLGSFGKLDALCGVRGIGPALAERLRPLVTFSGAPRPVSGACGNASNKSAKTRAQRSREPR